MIVLKILIDFTNNTNITVPAANVSILADNGQQDIVDRGNARYIPRTTKKGKPIKPPNKIQHQSLIHLSKTGHIIIYCSKNI